MTPINRIRKIVVRYFIDLRWQSIFFAIAIYMVLSWAILTLCGETDITQNANFLYWIMVTASTVGYGDFSPTTTAGKYATALFVIPLGLSIFGLVIGRIAAFISYHWKKGMLGLKALDYENHILIIGWNDNRTLQLVRLLLKETQGVVPEQKIALCVRANIDNPMPQSIGFVRTSSFSNEADMDRACIKKAACIIIDNPEDDITMTTALFCSKQNPNAHIMAYFKDEQLGFLLKDHCPNVECMPSVAVEMLAKSAMDPGSSLLHQQLLDSNHGMTQYSIAYTDSKDIDFATLFHTFKHQHQATLIGIMTPQSSAIELNPQLSATVPSNSTLYYIASKRIKDINWHTASN
ncbi:potassium channel family protein [Gammaproteobacteria bacterium AS21]|jgi:voltage-gated potassium channel